jgi:hypothetical protein
MEEGAIAVIPFVVVLPAAVRRSGYVVYNLHFIAHAIRVVEGEAKSE